MLAKLLGKMFSAEMQKNRAEIFSAEFFPLVDENIYVARCN